VEITQQKQIEAENEALFAALRQQNEQLRVLSARLAEVQEEERRVLARELHDRVGQYLTALSFNLGFIQSQIDRTKAGTEPLHARLDQATNLVEQTADAIRDIMAELRPPLLDEYGLVEALERYAADFAAWTKLEMIVQSGPIMPRPGSNVENTLSRIAQEALNNIAKHAQASRVTISIEADEQMVRLMIADNGIGFTLNPTPELKERQTWGLLTMHERAEMVGGLCRIDSQPGQGTTVVVEMPC
jgi:two-component system sensor histidine kinase UhpB